MKSVFYLYKHIKNYPINKNLRYSYGFGLIISGLIIIQILTGLFLSSFYVPFSLYASKSIDYINNEIINGFIIQRIHVILASFIFITLYSHFLRAIYYKMFKWDNRLTWWTGLILLYLCIVEAFTGYILPWGQMSFWGATVITNLFSILPLIGPWLVKFIWGGSIVGTLTLERFFMLHYLIPSIIAALIILHIGSIHRLGSTNTYKISKLSDLSFSNLYPYFIIKDVYMLFLILVISTIIIFYLPNLFDNLVNNIDANSKITPKHIVPEWYFLSFYIILKLILIKWLGIVIMFIFILFPVFLPFLNKTK